MHTMLFILVLFAQHWCTKIDRKVQLPRIHKRHSVSKDR